MGNITCQIIIDGKEKQITLQEDIATILRIFNKDSADELTLKKVGDICDDKNNFYIASYQRGYRWGKDEVNALLEDIYEVYVQGDKSPQYCLQPLVVKKRDNAMYTKKLGELDESGKVENSQEICEACYELLDGQQRLTTLWLILDILNAKLPSEPMYSIYYELVRDVDENFICKAKDTIKDWLGCHEEFNAKTKKHKSKRNEKDLDWIEDKRQKFKETILKKLYFIWYEVKDEKRKESEQPSDKDQSSDLGQSEKLFRKINKGKIELTNAELFKAMLLNDENARTEEEHRELEQISFEWDKIEQSLRNDEFWFFISNDTSEERTRIDYILEVYARNLEEANNYDVGKERYSFLVVQEKLKKETNGFDGIKKVWRDIVHVHDQLYSWYQDNELYHNIGFLVACEGKRRAIATETMVELYKKAKEKGINETKEIAKGEIYDRLIIKKWNYKEEGQGRGKKKVKKYDINLSEKYDVENLNYESDDKKYLVTFLLYSNIYPLLQQGKTRFPFKAYYEGAWDIEHINPQKSKTGIIDDLINCGKDCEEDCKKESIKLIWQYLEKTFPERVEGVTEKDENTLRNIWEDEYLKDGDDNIGNLVLLNSKINREYHNALFNQKRAKIIAYDRDGYFIPLTTKNVFLKYYTENPSDFIQWDEVDKEGYMDYLKIIFDEIIKWSAHSQKNKIAES